MLVFLSACGEEQAIHEDGLQQSPANSQNDASRTLIRVALTNSKQPPLTTDEGGLSQDIIEALNEVQDQYYFEQILIAPLRYQDLIKRQRIQMAAFSNLQWSWDEQQVQASLPMIHDRDVYIALNKPGYQAMLEEMSPQTSKVGVLGFHYRLVNYSADQKDIKAKYNMTLVANELAVFNMVELDRAKIGIVAESLLKYMQAKQVSLKQRILIAEKPDSIYDRYYVIHNSSPMRAEELNEFLRTLHHNGMLKSIYDKYGLPLPSWTQDVPKAFEEN